ncbi:uncharacterized protein [Penaeus vannamei]|uniref:Uncharacterized protein n=1 Tax=Penaeus vannamei TaxID=6689 RepID=A0A423SWM5_PENVA|nr:uncharacterized protein LOC113815831 [Penaeus vannamei]ROT68686.1 hypothetical protein C7M84_013168 [Penaeus vannamei]
MKTWILLCLLGLTSVALASPAKLPAAQPDDSFEDEPKRPYSFSWEASRHYHGAPDREHQEERGEDGITRGVFRYVDPRQKVQEVVYYSDDNGFHVDASNLPQDTQAVQDARFRFAENFERIRQQHAQIAAERGVEEYPAEEPETYEQVDIRDFINNVQLIPHTPRESAAVLNHRSRFAENFERIRQEHSQLAAQLEAQRAEQPQEYQ